MDIASPLTYSASGTLYIRRCEAAGVAPGALPFGADGSGVGIEADNSPGAAAKASAVSVPKTEADRMREDWMKLLGIRPDDLAKMSPADRDAFETRLREQVRDKVAADPNQKAGAYVNFTA